MKFARFEDGRSALVIQADGLQLLDVTASTAWLRAFDPRAAETIAGVLPAAGGHSWVEMISRWDEVRGAFGSLIELVLSRRGDSPALQPFETARLGPPLASPTSHIFSLSSNTVIHIQRAFQVMFGTELSADDVLKAKTEGLPPGGFTIWPDSVVGPNGTITPPKGTRLFDYEAECAVYVKRGGRNCEHVELWGHAAWNDLGVRDANLHLKKDSRWGPFSLNLMKNFDSANACGPWVAVDEGHDITKLQCSLKVNGEPRQDWNLADMIYSFDETLRFISTYATLRPGDVLTSGTGAGTAIEKGIDGADWLKPDDVVEITLDGAGTLRNMVGHW